MICKPPILTPVYKYPALHQFISYCHNNIDLFQGLSNLPSTIWIILFLKFGQLDITVLTTNLLPEELFILGWGSKEGS